MALQNILLVFLGGGLGSVIRFLLSKWLNPLFTNVFLGTFTVNIIGSVIIGFLLAYELEEILKKPVALFLITGFCGGFTTFSAFSAESLYLIKSNQYIHAASYVSGSLLLGILAVIFGFYLAKQF
jgi:CrcB protein